MGIQLSALVCSQDQRTLKVLQVLLADMHIETELCGDRDAATRHLVTRRFDGVFVDAAIESAAELLLDVKEAPGGQRAVCFAILEGKTSVKEAFSFGAGFILYKPLSLEKTKNSLRAAHGLMMRERRRQFRHHLEDVHARVSFGGAAETTCEILDLSEGGMAVHLREYTERRGKLSAQFTLPGQSEPIKAEAEITWADDHGRLGVHFTSMPSPSHAALESWLAERGRAVAADPHGSIKSRSKRRGGGGRLAAGEAISAANTATPPSAAVEASPLAPGAGPRARQTVRAGIEIGIKMFMIRGGEPFMVEAVCEDITPDGLGAKVNGELCPGEPVLLHLNLPSLEAMKIHADVRHRRRNRVGLEFVGLSRDQRNQLADVCELLPAAE
ncbi:MAG: PilZ domain-containing protein [Acidobacteriota bacterium]|nr:PilZ domain-containing protein [Acidobacteriota bacterium]